VAYSPKIDQLLKIDAVFYLHESLEILRLIAQPKKRKNTIYEGLRLKEPCCHYYGWLLKGIGISPSILKRLQTTWQKLTHGWVRLGFSKDWSFR